MTLLGMPLRIRWMIDKEKLIDRIIHLAEINSNHGMFGDRLLQGKSQMCWQIIQEIRSGNYDIKKDSKDAG